MNPPKFDEYDYISFLIATPKVFSCTEEERVQPDAENPPSHDAVTRFLRRLSNLTRFKSNRLINPDGKGNIPVSSAAISENGTRVHLRGYGFIKVFSKDYQRCGKSLSCRSDLCFAFNCVTPMDKKGLIL